jgi:hypothetical protein
LKFECLPCILFHLVLQMLYFLRGWTNGVFTTCLIRLWSKPHTFGRKLGKLPNIRFGPKGKIPVLVGHYFQSLSVFTSVWSTSRLVDIWSNDFSRLSLFRLIFGQLTNSTMVNLVKNVPKLKFINVAQKCNKTCKLPLLQYVWVWVTIALNITYSSIH